MRLDVIKDLFISDFFFTVVLQNAFSLGLYCNNNAKTCTLQIKMYYYYVFIDFEKKKWF